MSEAWDAVVVGSGPNGLVAANRLADALDEEIEQRGGTRLLAEVELPLIDLLALMEQTGIAVDIDHLQALEAEFAGGVKLAAEAAYAAIGGES